MGKPGDPDFRAYREVWGGKIAEVPQPFRRRFPWGRRKREVQVSLTVFYGIGRHFHADIAEEHNLVWDRREGVWRRCWDDAEGRGTTHSKKFATEAAARRWIRRMIERHFPEKTHKIRDLQGRARRWFYREGD